LTSPIYKARLRFCLRTTIAAVLAFAVAQFLTIPLHGLWVVLTAVVVIQISVGGSLRATAEYVIGTFGGAVYATAVGILVPHTTAIALAGVLALAIAPLAYAAAVNPSFRVAPFTAAIVLLISTELGEGPLESALYRLLEVVLGGAVAIAVSLLVFPERAHGLGRDAARRVLELLARALPELLAGFTRKADALQIRRVQDEIGRAMAAFQTIADEAKREHLVNLLAEPDPAVLVRVLLRLRHDLVTLGRSSLAPLPHNLSMRLGEPLAEIGASASDYLRASAGALTSRRSPPPLDRVEAALAAYASEMTAIRDQGLTRSLPSGEVERLFTLGFALQQLREDLAELADCLQDWARDHQHPVTSAPSHPESPAPPRDTGPTTRLPRNI
jgi:uncharacterized membrane protein YccC